MIEVTDVTTSDIDVADDFDDEEDDSTGRFVRPYAMTGGRTTADIDIALETQIQATLSDTERVSRYQWEKAQVLELAQRPIALIEVAARIGVPIGVARVIVSDLVSDRVMIAQKSATTNQTQYTTLLEKVLDGVRNL